MADQLSKLEISDGELIERAQSGDSEAFGELWTRHYRSAMRVARQFTSSIDADDLVSEAYARIYQRVLAGGGPSGAFRPYLYTTIRNLASTWGTAESRSVNVEEIQDAPDERIPDDPAAWALDRTLTARAFKTLPERWQTVLWYTEVEGMDPHEVAPIMGLTANGVAALSYRAREGLRTAWLQAHVSDASSSGECRWAIARLGGHARHSLTDRERGRLETHLADCAKCAIISDEVEEVGSHLALVLVPMILGGVVGGAVLSQLALPGAALAAAATPALPPAIAALASTPAVAGAGAAGTVAAGTVAGGTAVTAAGATVAASAGVPSLLGGLAAVVVIGGSVAVGVPVVSSTIATPDRPSISATAPLVPGSGTASPRPTPATTPDAASPDIVDRPDDASGGSGGSVDGVIAEPAPSAGDATVGSAVDAVVTGTGQAVGNAVGGVGSAVGGVVSGVVRPGPVAPPTTPVPPANPAPPVTAALQLGGTATPGAKIVIEVDSKGKGGKTSIVATVSPSGSWSASIPDAIRDGKVKIEQDIRGLVGIVGGLLRPVAVTTNTLGLRIDIKK